MILLAKRIVDNKLLDEVRRAYCCVNGCGRKAQAAHIKSRGAGGDDVSGNVAPLCWLHHSEQHTLGWPRFLQRYPEVRSWQQLKEGTLLMMRICRDCEFNGVEASDYPACDNAFRRDITECPGYRVEV